MQLHIMHLDFYEKFENFDGALYCIYFAKPDDYDKTFVSFVAKTPEEPEVFKAEASNEGQEKFDVALRCSCLLTKPEELYQTAANKDVVRLTLTRALPYTINLPQLLAKFTSLAVSYMIVPVC